MKLWLSKNSEIPLREQLTRQIILAISSGDLEVGEKLPSVREIAFRFKIHQNTVSTAYRWLEENGWAESRKGSGVFVKKLEKEKRETAKFQSENELDLLVSQFFRNVHRRGYKNSQIADSFKKFLDNPKPERILITEADENLRQIIFTELHSVIHFPMFGVPIEDLSKPEIIQHSVLVSTPKVAERLQQSLPKTATIFPLKINSVPSQVQGQHRPQPDELIGIVSGWERFLEWSKTFLIAAGIDAECLIIRDTHEKNFRKGLDSCLFVITDSTTAQILPKGLDIRVFKLIAEDSIEELKTILT